MTVRFTKFIIRQVEIFESSFHTTVKHTFDINKNVIGARKMRNDFDALSTGKFIKLSPLIFIY